MLMNVSEKLGESGLYVVCCAQQETKISNSAHYFRQETCLVIMAW